MRRRSKMSSDEILNEEYQEFKFQKTNSLPNVPDSRQSLQNDSFKINDDNASKYISNEPKETSKTQKTLKAKVISQTYRYGIIRGIRTKEQLINSLSNSKPLNPITSQKGENRPAIKIQENSDILSQNYSKFESGDFCKNQDFIDEVESSNQAFQYETIRKLQEDHLSPNDRMKTQEAQNLIDQNNSKNPDFGVNKSEKKDASEDLVLTSIHDEIQNKSHNMNQIYQKTDSSSDLFSSTAIIPCKNESSQFQIIPQKLSNSNETNEFKEDAHEINKAIKNEENNTCNLKPKSQTKESHSGYCSPTLSFPCDFGAEKNNQFQNEQILKPSKYDFEIIEPVMVSETYLEDSVQPQNSNVSDDRGESDEKFDVIMSSDDESEKENISIKSSVQALGLQDSQIQKACFEIENDKPQERVNPSAHSTFSRNSSFLISKISQKPDNENMNADKIEKIKNQPLSRPHQINQSLPSENNQTPTYEAPSVENLADRFQSIDIGSNDPNNYARIPFQGHYYDQYNQMNNPNINPSSQYLYNQPSIHSHNNSMYNQYNPYPYQNYQAYFSNYNSMAYAKWYQDYLRWFQSYQVQNSRQQSVNYSTVSSIKFPHDQDTLSMDVFSVQQVADNQILTPHEPVYQQDTQLRLTPQISSSCFINSFNVNGSLFLFSDSSQTILNVRTFDFEFDIDFPGPIITIKRNILISYMDKIIDKMSDGCIKLLWQVLCVFVRENGSPSLNDICEPLVRFTRKQNLKIPSLPNLTLNEGYSRVVEALLNNDIKAAVSAEIENKNWAFALALSSFDQNLYKRTLSRFNDSLNTLDFIYIFLCLKMGMSFDPGNMGTCLDQNWVHYLVMFLIHSSEANRVSNLTTLQRALIFKKMHEASLVVSVILDLTFNVEQSDEMFYPAYSLQDILKSPSKFDLLHFRTIEIYEGIKKLTNPSLFSPFFITYKIVYVVLFSTFNKEIAFEYAENISKIIFVESPMTIFHNFVLMLHRVSKRLFFDIQRSSVFPRWLSHLEKNLLLYPNIDPFSTSPSEKNSDNKKDQSIPQSTFTLSPNSGIQKSQIKIEKSILPPINMIKSEPVLNVSQGREGLENVLKPIDKIPLSVPKLNQIKTESYKRPNLPEISQDIVKPEPTPIIQPNKLEPQSVPIISKQTESSVQSPETLKSNIISNIGSIFKIFKPKNEIFLPDDSSPSIVYDSELRRYVDRSSDSCLKSQNETTAPPKTISSMASGQSSGQNLSIKGYAQKPTKELYITPSYKP